MVGRVGRNVPTHYSLNAATEPISTDIVLSLTLLKDNYTHIYRWLDQPYREADTIVKYMSIKRTKQVVPRVWPFFED